MSLRVPAAGRRPGFRQQRSFGRPAPRSHKALRSMIKKQLNRDKEKKYLCYSQALTGVSTTGAFVSVSDITQGDADNERIGEEVQPKTLEMRAAIQAEDADTYNLLRIMVVKAKAGNTLGLGDMPGSVLACVNQYTRAKCSVLYDNTFALNTYLATYKNTKMVDFKLNLDSKIHYDQTSSGAPPIGGGLYVYSVSDSGAVNHPDLAFETQLIYTE